MQRLVPLLALTACAAGTEPLNVDPVIPEPVVEACPAHGGRASEHFRDLRRVALEDASAVVEGTFGAVEIDSITGGSRVPLTIATVHRGPSFVAGHTVWFSMPGADIDTPSRTFVVGADSSELPRMEAFNQAWWGLAALIPSEERSTLGEALGYQRGDAVAAAVVEIVRTDETTTFVRTVRVLAGRPPPEVELQWPRGPLDEPLPGVSSTQYIATFERLEPIGMRFVGTTRDFREATPAALAMVEAILARPSTARDRAGLLAEGARGRTAWTFHVSPFVAATEIIGRSPCCSGAGGTYVGHQVLAQLRGTSTASSLVLGGPTYYGTETCGDRWLIASDVLAFTAEGPVSCAPAGGVASAQPLTVPRASLTDTPTERLAVGDWLAASDPTYRLAARSDTTETKRFTSPRAPWTDEPAWIDALAMSTDTVRVRVDQVTITGGLNDLEVSVSWSPDAVAPQTKAARLRFRCGDPRLTVSDATWIALAVSAEGARQGDPLSSTFLVPGVLLPDEWWVPQAVEKQRSRLQRP